MRDPIDQSVLAAALRVWGQTDDADDEADAAFERALLTQGVISPDDVVEHIFDHPDELGSAAFTMAGSPEWVWIHADGSTTVHKH
jgi:hypothetical protein